MVWIKFLVDQPSTKYTIMYLLTKPTCFNVEGTIYLLKPWKEILRMSLTTASKFWKDRDSSLLGGRFIVPVKPSYLISAKRYENCGCLQQCRVTNQESHLKPNLFSLRGAIFAGIKRLMGISGGKLLVWLGRGFIAFGGGLLDKEGGTCVIQKGSSV